MGKRTENISGRNKNYRLKSVLYLSMKLLLCSLVIGFVLFVPFTHNTFADICNDKLKLAKDSIKVIEEELQKAISQVKSGKPQLPSQRLKDEVRSLDFQLGMLRTLKECHHLTPPSLDRIRALCKQLRRFNKSILFFSRT